MEIPEAFETATKEIIDFECEAEVVSSLSFSIVDFRVGERPHSVFAFA